MYARAHKEEEASASVFFRASMRYFGLEAAPQVT
jgi:hypothetical protein